MMEYLYYIQGVHPVRVELDEDGDWDEVERYDRDKGDFVSDWRMSKRINDDMDCQKVSAVTFWEYIALLHADQKHENKPRRLDYNYYIQGVFAVRAKLDFEGNILYCQVYDHYKKGFIEENKYLNRLDEPFYCTKVSIEHFWTFIAKYPYRSLSEN